jgi:GMP synthase-like glutamine amidotransferase
MLIILGGSASVYETEKYSWLDRELDFISQEIKNEKKF